MKRVWFLALAWPLLLPAEHLEPSCKGCGAGKLMLQCDYYVARKGDLAKRHFCAEYAKIVDIDGASAKAAWYWLLAGEPDKAFDAALRAMKVGHDFAAGYAAQALVALGNAEEAKRYMARFRRTVKERGYFKKEVSTLSKLYPDKDFSCLK
ncbi:hypothetical protein [Hydrogenimonas sp.]